MVRLVFRPYTRLRRSICTSESLRTSTRVSPGFVLAGHRSPSFGSQHVCSWYACQESANQTPSQTPRGCAAPALHQRRISPQLAERAFAFATPLGLNAQRLAHMLDSLVRVSRRVGWNHNPNRRQLQSTTRRHAARNPLPDWSPKTHSSGGPESPKPKRAPASSCHKLRTSPRGCRHRVPNTAGR